MKKLLMVWVFVAIAGLTTACGASPVDLGEIDGAGGPDPNGLYSELNGGPDPNG